MKIIKLMLIFFIFSFISLESYSQQKIIGGGVNTRNKSETMQLGWLGISAKGTYSLPSGDISNVLNGSLGAELTVVYRNFILNDFDIQLSSSYQNYTNKADSSNQFQTINVKLLGRYNFFVPDVPGCIYVEAGGGVSFETLTASSVKLDNIDPIYHFGVGYEIGIFENFTLQTGINYLLMPQKYIVDAIRDGSFINFSIGINYEFLEEKGGKRK
ncbi:MAG: hypothetical protein ABH873_03525 [Candidatus Firestonebacteria bacterium]